MAWVPDVCFYHFPCDDGFASAWIVRDKWPDCVLVGTNYGEAMPSDITIAGKNVLIADFSFKPDVLDGMAEEAKSIVILDHHKSAAEDLANIDSFSGDHIHVGGMFAMRTEAAATHVLAWFDMEQSGAMLTWRFAHGLHSPAPQLIRHVEDRDLWRFRLPDTRAFILWLRSFPHDFGVWDRLAEETDYDYGSVMREALSIERFYNNRITEMADGAVIVRFSRWEGVPVVHAPGIFASDVGHELLKRNPDAPFAVIVSVAHGRKAFSLRSEDGRQDVSEVARIFGGGGHRNSAGFSGSIPL